MMRYRDFSKDFTKAPGLPAWVPEMARHYLAHTEDGAGIRALARSAGCHASTVLRQVRRMETLRDDPLVDEMLLPPDVLLRRARVSAALRTGREQRTFCPLWARTPAAVGPCSDAGRGKGTRTFTWWK